MPQGRGPTAFAGVGAVRHTIRACGATSLDSATEGLDRALYDAPRSGAPPTFTPRQQQRVVALACTDPPEGRTRWTLELLCEHAIKQGFVTSVSKSEVALWLKEHDMKPWRKKLGAFPSSRKNFVSGWKRSLTSTKNRMILPSQ